LRKEREALAIERGQLQGRLDEMAEPGEAMEQQLNETLTRHREVKDELARARDAAVGVESRVNEREHKRRECSNRVTELRESLEAARLSAQQLKTRREGLVEQLDELEVDLESVLEGIEEGAEIVEWEQRLEKTTQR